MRAALLTLLTPLVLAAPAAVLAQRAGTPRAGTPPPATTPVPPPAAAAPAPDSAVALAVTLDHADWLYHVGDTARFRVSLLRAGKPLADVPVRVSVAQERMRPFRTDTLDLARGPRTVAGTLAVPGFVRATATAVVGGVTYTQMATAGFDPERIEPTTTMPPDFAAFWQRAVAEARRVPLQPVMTRLPQWSTPEVDVYHVSFQNHRAGSRLYGMLSVPTAPGKHPAMLVVPGAGVRPYFPDVAMARRGVIHLAIGIHGIPVDRDSLLYNELRATALADYMRAGIEDRDAYYYKRVFVGVVRAGDFLFSLPQFDGTDYVVQGGSQGGILTLVAAALDPRVKAIAVTHPAMADHFGYLYGRAGGWPHVFADTTRGAGRAEKMETLRYYDAVNFARLVRVPGFYTWGYNDTTVPPTSAYAAYNVVAAPKELHIYKETGHFRVPEQAARTEAWLLERLGVREH
jgi:cephalosporin-C deacetylase-like acetyl esterase